MSTYRTQEVKSEPAPKGADLPFFQAQNTERVLQPRRLPFPAIALWGVVSFVFMCGFLALFCVAIFLWTLIAWGMI